MVGSALAAGGCLAAGALLAARPTRRVGVLGRVRAPRGPGWSLDRLAVRRSWLLALAGPALVLVLLGPATVAVFGLAAVGAGVVVSRRRRSLEARAASELTRAVADLASALAADLSAGHPPVSSIAALADEHRTGHGTAGAGARDELRQTLDAVLAAARLGGDVPATLRSRAVRPGARGLRAVAAGWEVAETTGAPLAPVLEQVAGGLRDQLAADRAVGVALAGSRSSARLLAGLPLVGLAMGAGLGVAPMDFLLGTTVGRACLLLGLALEVAGLAWTDALARAALRPGAP